MSLIKQIIVVVVLVGLGAAGWFGFGQALIFGDDSVAARGTPGARPGGQPRPGGPFGRGGSLVVTATVEIDDSGLDVRAVGTAAAARAVTIFSEVTGIVADVAFAAGAEVEQGDVLLRLTDADQRVAVERARLTLDTARAALERSQRLAQTNNISSVALTDARNAVRRAEIDLRIEEIELAKRSVRAPFAGKMGLTDLTVGDLVNSSTIVATLDDLSSIMVAFDVPERATGLVSIGHLLTATTQALPGVTLTGTITEIDSRVDSVSRTLRVRATLPNADRALRPGMAIIAVMRFDRQPRPQVPSLAVQWDREGPYVWKVVEGVARRTGINIVDRRSGAVTIVGDVAEGDQVVVEGLQSLRNGGAVRIAGAPAAEGGARPGQGPDSQTGQGFGGNAGARPQTGEGPPAAGERRGPRGSAVAGQEGGRPQRGRRPGGDGQRGGDRPDGAPNSGAPGQRPSGN